MVAVAWAAVGLPAATLFGNVYRLGARIDGLSARLDEHIHGRGPRRA